MSVFTTNPIDDSRKQFLEDTSLSTADLTKFDRLFFDSQGIPLLPRDVDKNYLLFSKDEKGLLARIAKPFVVSKAIIHSLKSTGGTPELDVLDVYCGCGMFGTQLRLAGYAVKLNDIVLDYMERAFLNLQKIHSFKKLSRTLHPLPAEAIADSLAEELKGSDPQSLIVVLDQMWKLHHDQAPSLSPMGEQSIDECFERTSQATPKEILGKFLRVASHVVEFFPANVDLDEAEELAILNDKKILWSIEFQDLKRPVKETESLAEIRELKLSSEISCITAIYYPKNFVRHSAK